MMAFSDFVPDVDLPNYMHNTQLMQYLTSYAEHFHLVQHVQFDTLVQVR